MVDVSSGVLRGKDWALAGGGGWVRGEGINDSDRSTLVEGLEKVELQRKQDGKEAFPWYDP